VIGHACRWFVQHIGADGGQDALQR
jgi:hypothetical protein